MKAFFKGNITDENLALPLLSNRGFLYGDGMFETMIAHNGQVKYLNDHLARITEALNYLRISIPDELQIDKAHEIIRHLSEQVVDSTHAKVKIIVWRKEGGTYAPSSNSAELIITLDKIQPVESKQISKIDFCEGVKNQFSSYSKFKSISALSYVMAGQEKTAKELEDLIILDNNGNVSECLVSNLFWVKDNTYFTPSLKTGCIEGISRRVIIRELQKKSIKVKEVLANKNELLNADSVFCTNALGICHIMKIKDQPFSKHLLIEDIFQPY